MFVCFSPVILFKNTKRTSIHSEELCCGCYHCKMTKWAGFQMHKHWLKYRNQRIGIKRQWKEVEKITIHNSMKISAQAYVVANITNRPLENTRKYP